MPLIVGGMLGAVIFFLSLAGMSVMMGWRPWYGYSFQVGPRWVGRACAGWMMNLFIWRDKYVHEFAAHPANNCPSCSIRHAPGDCRQFHPAHNGCLGWPCNFDMDHWPSLSAYKRHLEEEHGKPDIGGDFPSARLYFAISMAYPSRRK
jgi:hypothetical protein